MSDGTIIFPEVEQDISEFDTFMDTIEALQIESILEIGVFRGGTITRLGARFPYCTIVGIDPAPQIERWSPEWGTIQLIYGKSQDTETRAKAIHANNNRKFDIIWIDGDHEIEPVKEDWLWAAANARKAVAFHDIVNNGNPMIEVWQLWDSIHASPMYKTKEIRLNGECWGIGVVYL